MTSPSTHAAGAGSRPVARDIALVAVFAALIAVLTMAPAIPVGGLGVPITLQTLAVALAALTLGGIRGFLAAALYVIVGLAGLPVFAKFSAGLGVLAGPSAGYLLSFPLAALVAGALATWALRRVRRGRVFVLWACALAGSFVIIHPAGIAGMMLNAHLSLPAAFGADLLFWPGDLIKSFIAAAIATGILKAFPALAARRVAAL